MMIADHDIWGLSELDFQKKKTKKNGFGLNVLLEIEYSDSLGQCLTSSGGKTHTKKFGPNGRKLPFSQVSFISFPLNCIG